MNASFVYDDAAFIRLPCVAGVSGDTPGRGKKEQSLPKSSPESEYLVPSVGSSPYQVPRLRERFPIHHQAQQLDHSLHSSPPASYKK